MLPIKDDEFKKLVGFVKDKFGINLTQKRTLIESRLSSLLIERDIDNYSQYIDLVLNDKSGNELTELLNKVTTNLTYFMREEEHFRYFSEKVLPMLEQTVKSRDLRIWCAGCSTGEEPYTLAMLIAQHFQDRKQGWDTKILATDISNKVLTIAKRGAYSAEQIENIPPMWKSRYFDRIDKSHYIVNDKIKKEVIFGIYNLMEEQMPFKKDFHVIFCRNVMIYFEQDTKNALIERFYNVTEPGGYLFIGHSESIDRRLSRYDYIMPAVYRKTL
jgi:chemotaxis protein methyltransferase CheR